MYKVRQEEKIMFVWAIILVVAFFDLLLQFRYKNFSFRNDGIGFGVLPGVPHWLLVMLVVVFGLWLIAKWDKFSKMEKLGSTLVVVGGGANQLSRVFLGSIVDYLDIFMFSFNVSDLMIVVGFLVFSYSSISPVFRSN